MIRITVLLLFLTIFQARSFSQIVAYQEFNDFKANTHYSHLATAFDDLSAYFYLDHKLMIFKNEKITSIDLPDNALSAIGDNLPHLFDTKNKRSYHISADRNNVVIADYNNDSVTFESVPTELKGTSIKTYYTQFLSYKETFLLLIFDLKPSIGNNEIKTFIIKKYNRETHKLETLCEYKPEHSFIISGISVHNDQLYLTELNSEEKTKRYTTILKSFNLDTHNFTEIHKFERTIKFDNTVMNVEHFASGGEFFEANHTLFVYAKYNSLVGEEYIDVVRLNADFEIIDEFSFQSAQPITNYSLITPLDFVLEGKDFYMINCSSYYREDDPENPFYFGFKLEIDDHSLHAIEINSRYEVAGILPDPDILPVSGYMVDGRKYPRKYNEKLWIVDVPYADPKNNVHFVCRIAFEHKAKIYSGYISFVECPQAEE